MYSNLGVGFFFLLLWPGGKGGGGGFNLVEHIYKCTGSSSPPFFFLVKGRGYEILFSFFRIIHVLRFLGGGG